MKIIIDQVLLDGEDEIIEENKRIIFDEPDSEVYIMSYSGDMFIVQEDTHGITIAASSGKIGTCSYINSDRLRIIQIKGKDEIEKENRELHVELDRLREENKLLRILKK